MRSRRVLPASFQTYGPAARRSQSERRVQFHLLDQRFEAPPLGQSGEQQRAVHSGK